MGTSTRRADTASAEPRRVEYFSTPYGVGRLTLAGDLPLELDLPGAGVELPDRPAAPGGKAAEAAPSDAWVVRLEAYFAGEPVAFDLDVEAHCRVRGFTGFESDVYAALAEVPYGRAVSYRDLAHAAGRPNAYRAVGTAMAHNALPVILPCHRVIKNDGTPGLYGEDPTWKIRLLQLEGALRPGAAKVARAMRGGGER
jgi:O-6-methylguanine DNA methyltransferase